MDFCRARPRFSSCPYPPAPRPRPPRSPTALSFVTRHVSGPSCTSFFLVISRFWRQEGVPGWRRAQRGGEGRGQEGQPAGTEEGLWVEGWGGTPS